MYIKSVEINGLFGYVNHSMDFTNNVTVITAPNGTGKTKVFKIIDCIANLKFFTLFNENFNSASIIISENNQNRYNPASRRAETIKISLSKKENSLNLSLSLYDQIGKEYENFRVENFNIPIEDIIEDSHNISKMGGRKDDNIWVENQYRNKGNDEKFFNFTCKRYLYRNLLLDNDFIKNSVQQLWYDSSTLFIDTKRIDMDEANFSTSKRYGAKNVRSRLYRRIDGLQKTINDARYDSLQISQQQDAKFVSSALDMVAASVKKDDVVDKYNRISEINKKLAQNYLVTSAETIALPESLNPTARRLLSLYLNNLEVRLEPLIRVNEKLTTLQNIIDSKLKDSGKKTYITKDGKLEFRTLDDRKLGISNLSSGEQHMITLYVMLLFNVHDNQVVLVDEPEISMHASWKIEFLKDVIEISNQKNLQLIIATHSITLISGRWDLTNELQMQLPPLGYSADENVLSENESMYFEDGDSE